MSRNLPLGNNESDEKIDSLGCTHQNTVYNRENNYKYLKVQQ